MRRSGLTTAIKLHDEILRRRLLRDFGAQQCVWLRKVEREMLTYIEASVARGIDEFRIHLFPKGAEPPPPKSLKKRAQCAQTLLKRKYGIHARVEECKNTTPPLYALKIKIFS